MRKGREAKKRGEGTVLAKFAQVTEQSLSFPLSLHCSSVFCHGYAISVCMPPHVLIKPLWRGRRKEPAKTVRGKKKTREGIFLRRRRRLPISPVFPFVFYCSGLAPLLLRYLAEVRDSTTMSRGMNFSKEHKKRR